MVVLTSADALTMFATLCKRHEMHDAIECDLETAFQGLFAVAPWRMACKDCYASVA